MDCLQIGTLPERAEDEKLWPVWMGEEENVYWTLVASTMAPVVIVFQCSCTSAVVFHVESGLVCGTNRIKWKG